jgi:hypothetical protein
MTMRILNILVRLEQGAQLHLLEQPVVRLGEGQRRPPAWRRTKGGKESDSIPDHTAC